MVVVQTGFKRGLVQTLNNYIFKWSENRYSWFCLSNDLNRKIFQQVSSVVWVEVYPLCSSGGGKYAQTVVRQKELWLCRRV